MSPALVELDARVAGLAGEPFVAFSAMLPLLEVPAAGASLAAAWAPVAGATAAVVDAAPLQIGRAQTVESSGELGVEANGNARIVSLPAGAVVRALTLGGLDLLGRRLVVALPSATGWEAPQFAVPAVNPRGALPPSLTGASLHRNVLSLPDVRADKLRLTAVTGDFPEEFGEQPFTLGTVSAQLLRTARDVTVKDAAHVTLWAFPGELPAADPPPQDLRTAVQAAFADRLAAGQAPSLTFTVGAASPGRVGCSFPTPRGALERVAPAPVGATLVGEPAALDPGSPALPAERPSAVRADLRVAYAGLRLLEQPRDPVPPPHKTAAGRVVEGTDAVRRALPPELFASFAPGRLSLAGRSPGGCTLSVTLEAAGGGRAPLAPAVSIDVPAADTFALVHAELAPLAAPVTAAAIAVRTTAGRFLWAGEPEPAVQIAVRDPDPGGRPIRLAGRPWLSCTSGTSGSPGRRSTRVRSPARRRWPGATSS